jgi:GDPmannose 4,6-dehydratase
MPCSLVLGVNGQDGSYLAEALLRRGHDVVGVGRNPESRHVAPSARFRYVDLDLRNSDDLKRLVDEVAPDFAFHFAAVHGSAGFQYEPVVADMFATNVVALHVLLEHARLARKPVRVVYAGSSKIFPAPLIGTVDETTSARATCLYSIGKMAARDLIFQYRASHGVAATNLVLFNHESPRRPKQFLLPMLAGCIGSALADPQHQLTVQTLDFRIDWAAADELCDIAADIAIRCDVDELVFASGTTHHAREIVETLFRDHGLASDQHIIERLPRSDPGPMFRVALDRLERTIGRKPVKTVQDIVYDMLAGEVSMPSQEAL